MGSFFLMSFPLVGEVGGGRLPVAGGVEVHAVEDLGQDHLDLADGPEAAQKRPGQVLRP